MMMIKIKKNKHSIFAIIKNNVIVLNNQKIMINFTQNIYNKIFKNK